MHWVHTYDSLVKINQTIIIFFKLKYNYLIICVAESTSITEVNVINPTKLYGSKVNEIECLENNLQSEFEKFCATKKPVLWPGMAFNWDVPGIYDNLFILYTY